MAKKKKKKKAPQKQPPIKRMPVVDPETLPAKLAEVQAPRVGGMPPASRLIPPEEALDSNRYLRWSAGLFYTTDLRGATLEAMAKHPFFGKVSMQTLANWSTQDRWVERRQNNMEQWRQLIENKIGSELVRARTQQLEQMRVLFDKVMAKAMNSRLKVRSLEGAVSVLVRMADLMDVWNEKLFRTVIPDMPGAAASPMSMAMMADAKPKLTQHEARSAARAVLEARRAAMRREMDRDKGVTPQLQVLEGDK